ncbi:MAG TPA: hypothetical protein VL997_04575, partial [Dyella sp.]|nr:hypothetical protein [Dyella sp.]
RQPTCDAPLFHQKDIGRRIDFPKASAGSFLDRFVERAEFGRTCIQLLMEKDPGVQHRRYPSLALRRVGCILPYCPEHKA